MRQKLFLILAILGICLFQACQIITEEKETKEEDIHELNPPFSHFEQLKELDWLAGNWEDDDESIDVTYTYEWDKNKNFSQT